jgi:hypothetical protein
MALKSSLLDQVGFKIETTWGTAVVVDRFLPLVSESITQQIDRMESAGILAGRRTLSSTQWAAGNVTVGGDLNIELCQQSMGTIWKWALGANATTGSGPYIHTATIGDLPGATLQVGRRDIGGTTDAFTWAGCKCESWEMAGKAGEILTAGFTVSAKSETTATALASASYTSGVDIPFNFTQASFTVGGSAASVKEFSIKGDNGLKSDRRFLGSATIAEQLETDLRMFTGELTCEFESLAAYNRFVNATTAAPVLTVTADANTSVVVTFPSTTRWDGTSPTVGGREVTEVKFPFKALATSDASTISIATTNSDITA